MRFFCEWCFERVEIYHTDAPYVEVLDHFVNCSHHSSLITEKQITGLAQHIAGLVGDNAEFALRVKLARAG